MKNYGEAIKLENPVEVKSGLFLTVGHLCLIAQRFTDNGITSPIGIPAIYFDTVTSDGKPGDQLGVAMRQGGVSVFRVVEDLPQFFATAGFLGGSGMTFRGLPNPATPGRPFKVTQRSVEPLFLEARKHLDTDVAQEAAAYGLTEDGLRDANENKSLSQAIRDMLGLEAGIMANCRGGLRAVRNGETDDVVEGYNATRAAREAGTYRAGAIPSDQDAFADPTNEAVPF